MTSYCFDTRDGNCCDRAVYVWAPNATRATIIVQSVGNVLACLISSLSGLKVLVATFMLSDDNKALASH